MNHRRHRRLFAALAIAVAVVVGAAFTTACKPSAPTAGNEHGHDGNALGTIGTPDQAFKRDPALTGPINVVCTTGMIADVTRRVGGEFVTVTQLMNFVSDPHSYKATEGDVRALSGAEVIFYNGLMLEGKMSDLFARMSSKRLTVPVGEAVPQELRREVAGHPDPHIWFDVSLWQRATKLICEALANYDNLHAEKIRRNWRKVDADLDQLHQVAKQHIAQIPKERRVLVTAHDAFGYFGRAYDIEVRAIQGISTEDEAGVAAINELKQFIVQRKIRAVFIESTVNPRSIQSLIEGCESMGHKVVVGGELFSDAMGEAGKEGDTYLGMVRHNVDTIVQALGE